MVAFLKRLNLQERRGGVPYFLSVRKIKISKVEIRLGVRNRG